MDQTELIITPRPGTRRKASTPAPNVDFNSTLSVDSPSVSAIDSEGIPSISKARASTNRPSSKLKTPLAPTARVHPPLDSYHFKVIVEVSIKVGKLESVYPVFRTQILKGLTLLQEVDPDSAFLPKPSSKLEIPIYDALSFSDKQYIVGINYFAYENDYSLFSTNKTENGRWIRFSAHMGFNADPREFLPAMKVDLMMLGVSYTVKNVQSLETCASIVFLGTPQNINKEYAKEVLDLHLQPLERELSELDPCTYPPEIHDMPWPEFSMACDQPQGIFQPYAKGMARTQPPRERRTL
jgi:hypothetical protein